MLLMILAVIFACTSALLAANKRRNGFGWFCMGLVFGPVGLIVALLPELKTGENYRKCPFCAEMIKAEAVKCRFCGSPVQPEIIELKELVRHGQAK